MFARVSLISIVGVSLLGSAGCSKAPTTTASSNGTAAAAASSSAAGGFSFASDPCEAVFNAMVAQAKQPYVAAITTTKPSGSPTQSETRVVAGKSYFQVDGKWHSVAQTTDQMVADLTSVHKSATGTCKVSGDEAVGGKSATVFDAHIVNQGSASDNRLWVSKDTGLPLKSEAHLEGGEIVAQVFEYDNVTAPIGG
jgi:hypothetical protein